MIYSVGYQRLTPKRLSERAEALASMVDGQPDEAKLADRFADMVIEALRDMQKNPEAVTAQRRERIKFIRDNDLWAARAKEWVAWLSELVGSEAANALQRS
jgi:hypothetical protein